MSYISYNNNPETLSLCSFIILIFNDKTSFERRRLKCMHKMKEKGLILKYILQKKMDVYNQSDIGQFCNFE